MTIISLSFKPFTVLLGHVICLIVLLMTAREQQNDNLLGIL